MFVKKLNSNNEQNNLDEPLVITNSSFNRYKCHLICSVIWIIVICIMIAYYYLN